MRFEFNQGVPAGCVNWLIENVGEGNRASASFSIIADEDKPEYDWYYERVFIPYPNSFRGEGKNVPTITVKDEKKAMFFALRWL